MTEQSDLEAIALAALRDVASDRKAPAAARAAAARTLLETAGRIGRLQAPGSGTERPLNEMSASEIASEISRLRADRASPPEPDPDPFADLVGPET